jgi:hypothetical protein
VVAKAVEQAMTICYQRGVLPSEANQSWAEAGESVELGDYRFFPSLPGSET